jgi:drug/metabolite transporter (DMT)-like permease
VNRRSILLFGALGIAWGIPYLLIKISVTELDPATVVLARTALGALLLLPLAFARGQVLVVLRRWRPLLAYTVAEIVLPWFFLSTAELKLPSSTAGLLIAAVPLVGVAVAYFFGRPARLTLTNWIGIAVGMIGVAALVGLDVAGSDLIAVAEVAVVVVGYAVGPAIQSRWMSDLPGAGVVAVSLAITAVIYLPFVGFTGGFPTRMPSLPVILSVVTLAVVCSAAGFLIMIALIREVGPMRMTTVTYINPAVAIVVGALVLGEKITVWTVVGFVLVLSGSFLVTRRRRATAPIAAAPVAEASITPSADSV